MVCSLLMPVGCGSGDLFRHVKNTAALPITNNGTPMARDIPIPKSHALITSSVNSIIHALSLSVQFCRLIAD
jgi:hypothetical protein